MKKPKFEMYDVLRDKVTGYTGVVLGVSHYFTGCRHYGLAQQNIDKATGKLKEWEWLDETRLEFVKKSGITEAKEETSSPSMPHQNQK
jgi:hypothetical protein